MCLPQEKDGIFEADVWSASTAQSNGSVKSGRQTPCAGVIGHRGLRTRNRRGVRFPTSFLRSVPLHEHRNGFCFLPDAGFTRVGKGNKSLPPAGGKVARPKAVTDEGAGQNADDEKIFSQRLRKEATPEEKHLWYDFLKSYPTPFRRQVPFGPYFLDFYCAKARLGVELDGSQHDEEEKQQHDQIRTEFPKKTYQIEIVRFTNLDIKQNVEGVCLTIHQEVKRRAPSSAPSGGTFPPEGGRLYGQEVSMKTVTIYTDGACSGNPGPGGWGGARHTPPTTAWSSPGSSPPWRP